MNNLTSKNKKKQPMEEEKSEILAGLNRTRDELKQARADFNMATEPELVEACVYRINALHAQYAFYLRLAKENNMEQSYGAACAHDKIPV